MNVMQAIKTENQVLRPLRVLVPLIKQDIKDGDEAGMPYFQAAGEKLLEAKAQLAFGEFTPWCKRNFDKSMDQCNLYMSYATLRLQKPASPVFSSLNEFERAQGNSRPTDGAVRRDWTKSIDEIVSKVNIDTLNTRRAAMEQAEEAKAQKDLALKLIDIGYKVLAKELHPDKGGSPAAMSRLNEVRKRLRQCA